MEKVSLLILVLLKGETFPRGCTILVFFLKIGRECRLWGMHKAVSPHLALAKLSTDLYINYIASCNTPPASSWAYIIEVPYWVLE